VRYLVAFISKSLFQASLVAGLFGALSIAIVPISIVSAGVVAFVAMRRGFNNGFTVAFSATVIVVVLGVFIESRPGLSWPVVFFLYPPVLLGAWVLKETQSQGLLVLSAGVISTLFVLGMYLVSDDVTTFWQNWLSVAVSGVEGATVKGFELDGTLPLMNGIITTVYTLSLVISLFIGRYLQSLAYNPGGFNEEFYALKIPFLALTTIIALIALSAAANQQMMMDLLMVFSAVFFFQGLAVLHGVVHKRKMGIGWLLPPYAGVLLVPRFIIVGLAILGVLDVLVDFRSRSNDGR